MPLTPELLTLVDVIRKEKIVGLLAPSFPVDFEYPQILLDLKKISIEHVVELTYAAKLINIEYQRILKENPERRYICPNCPTVVKLIEARYPELKEYIIDVASPMVIMDRFVKREYGPERKTLFIGPCVAKKVEAKENNVDYAITFKELQEIFDHFKENNIPYDEFTHDVTEDGTPDFDHFYNDYTKIYPLAGWIADSLNYRWELSKDQVYVVDGPAEVAAGIEAFKSNPKIRFLDILMCTWWCIWGPGMMSQAPLEEKVKKVYDYKEYCRKDKIWSKLGKFEHAEGLDMKR